MHSIRYIGCPTSSDFLNNLVKYLQFNIFFPNVVTLEKLMNTVKNKNIWPTIDEITDVESRYCKSYFWNFRK